MEENVMMRTDLALEERNRYPEDMEGVEVKERTAQGIRITCLTIHTEKAAELLHKPVGSYVTAEGMRLTDEFREAREHIQLLAKEIRRMLPQKGDVMAVGLGNRSITPDALGPKCTEYILPTRHLQGELARSVGLEGLRSVTVMAPGVLGQTGAEAGEIIAGLVKELKPSGVIAIDALAARSLQRLGQTVQLCSAGIAPGSGVGNHRMKLNRESLGVPVIGIGVPTVVDAATLAQDLLGEELSGKQEELLRGSRMMVTPREIDLLTDRAAKLVGMAVNCALQPGLDFDTLAALVPA